MELLIEHGAWVNFYVGQNTPIQLAMNGGNPRSVIALLKAGAILKEQILDDKWLVCACEWEMPSAIPVLIKAGCNPNAKLTTESRPSILKHSLQSGQLDFAAELILCGASYRKNISDINLLNFAEQHKNYNLMEAVLKCSTKGGLGKKFLTCAIKNGEVEKITAAIKAEVDYQSQFVDGSALIYACEHGNTALITALLERGETPFHSDKDGRNTMHHAVQSGDVEKVRVLQEYFTFHYLEQSLIKYGLAAPDLAGETALHWGMTHGDKNMIKYLISVEAISVKTAKNRMGETPIMLLLNRTSEGEILAVALQVVSDQFISWNSSRK